jgi:hypothetical protein
MSTGSTNIHPFPWSCRIWLARKFNLVPAMFRQVKGVIWIWCQLLRLYRVGDTSRWVWSILTRKNQSTPRGTCPSFTLSTTNHTLDWDRIHASVVWGRRPTAYFFFVILVLYWYWCIIQANNSGSKHYIYNMYPPRNDTLQYCKHPARTVTYNVHPICCTLWAECWILERETWRYIK